MRLVFVTVHRWAGLFVAVFLLVAGLTGGLIAWDHELDEALNPEIFRAPGSGPLRGALELADQAEREDPRLRVSYLPLQVQRGQAQVLSVEPRATTANKPPEALGFDQLFVDPSDGKRLGQRTWGELSLARKNLIPFLYKLHYSLHLPSARGVELGTLLMGLVAIVWTLDALVALYISFPSLASWRKSFAFRLRAGGHKLTFDLHRSGGVWLWLLLFPFGVSAISMNLGEQVVEPVVQMFSPLTPGPFDGPEPEGLPQEPLLDRHAAVRRAVEEARARGLTAPAGGIFYASARHLYGVGFFESGQEHGDGGLGNTWLYLNADSGKLVAAQQPGRGSAGDVFMQLQFPLHSGRIFGIVGRVLVTLLGLGIATLSATGVVLWARKRKARRATRYGGQLDAEAESKASASA